MKRKQIKLGGVYCAKVSGKLVDVVITDESRHGGWTAMNCITGKVLHIKTAGRLRFEITKPSPEHPIAPVWPEHLKPRVTEVLAAGTEPTKDDKAAAKAGAITKLQSAPKEVTQALDAAIGGKTMKASGKAGGKAARARAMAKAVKAAKAVHTKVKPAKPAKPKAPRRLSGLDLAAQVLSDAGKPMTAADITAGVIKRGWATKGQTPSATLYAAMLREVDNKPGESRFEKTGRGMFAATRKN